MKPKVNGKPSALLPTAAPRCAIYARKSTDDSSRTDENRSTSRQVEHAKEYARKKGWQMLEDHIYVDDNVSGGEFANRHAFNRLIADLPTKGKAPFDCLIMSEPSRFARDQQRAGYFLAHVHDCGVQIWYYLTDEEERLDSPEHVFMSAARAFAAEAERIKASQRSRDALMPKAKAGYNTGGSAFGYLNVIVNENGEKSHTDYTVDRQEADTVRRIFKMYRDGWGFTSVAKALNCDSRYLAENRKYFAGRTPKPPRNGTGSWAPSSIREMLYNERYTGKVPWGEFKKVWKHGHEQRVKNDAPMSPADRPDLRIVPKDLWNAVQRRLKAVGENYRKVTKGSERRDTGRVSPYLLSGIARCGSCGASMIATKVALGSGKTRQLVPHYMCSAANKRGDTVCSHNTRRRVDETDERVRQAIEQSLLRPEAVNLEGHLKLVEEQRRKEPEKAKGLEGQIKRLKRERDNLLAMRAHGELPASVLAEITKREQGIAQAEADLAKLPPKEFDVKDIGTLKASMVERMGEFRTLLRADIPTAREALRKLIGDQPIRCVPIMWQGRKDFGIRGGTQLGALLSSAPRIPLRIAEQKAKKPAIARMASPPGFEPRLRTPLGFRRRVDVVHPMHFFWLLNRRNIQIHDYRLLTAAA